MSLSINSKLLTCSILLVAPIAQFYAITLENGSILGKDNNYSQYRSDNNGTWVYDFKENSQLKLDDSTQVISDISGVKLNSNGASTSGLKFENKLDISITRTNNKSVYGVNIGSGVNNSTVDRSLGGDIIINIKKDTSSNFTVTEAVNSGYGENNKILLGDSNIDMDVVDIVNGFSLSGITLGGSGNLVKMGNGSIEINANTLSSGNFGSQALGVYIWAKFFYL